MIRTAKPAHGVALSALALACLLAAACGYRMETVNLPKGARNLHVTVIDNRTFTAELDVRMQRELRRLLYRDAGIRVTGAAESDLTLEVTLTRLNISRGRNLDDTDVTSLAYALSGNFSLIDTATGKPVTNRQAISGNSSLNFDDARVETPAVRDEGLDDALRDFARKVVDRLLLTF